MGTPLCSQSRVAKLESRGQAKVFTVWGWNWTGSQCFSPAGKRGTVPGKGGLMSTVAPGSPTSLCAMVLLL